MTVVLFVAAFLSLAVMFWPYMIPYSVTVASAAAPEASLSFLFWGAGLFVLPVIGVYTAVVYWMFRGRQRKGRRAPPRNLNSQKEDRDGENSAVVWGNAVTSAKSRSLKQKREPQWKCRLHLRSEAHVK
jgi:hypothetical protein